MTQNESGPCLIEEFVEKWLDKHVVSVIGGKQFVEQQGIAPKMREEIALICSKAKDNFKNIRDKLV